MVRARPDQSRLFADDPAARSRGRASRALEETLRQLRAAGSIEPVDAARVALARTIAEAVDAERAALLTDAERSRFTLATLVRTAEDTLDRLYPTSRTPTLPDDVAALLTHPRNAPPT